MEQFPFRDLPLEVKIQFLANVNEDEFYTLHGMLEFDYLLSQYPNSERIFEERSIKKFTDLIQFKDQDTKPMTWKEFYMRMNAILSRYKRSDQVIYKEMNDITLRHLVGEDKLMELKLIYSITSPPHLTDDWGANQATGGHLDTLKWLESKGVLPNQAGANWAAGSGKLEILEWLEIRGILPTQFGTSGVAQSNKVDVLEWLSKRGILPTTVEIAHAANYGYIDVVDWAYQKGIKPDRRTMDPKRIKRYPELVKWFVAHTPKS